MADVEFLDAVESRLKVVIALLIYIIGKWIAKRITAVVRKLMDVRDVDPTLVAGGIKVALLTTATGLLIAIPVNIGYNFFVTRIDMLILDMEQGAQKILNLAWDMEKKGTLEILGKGTLATRSTGPAEE